MLENASELMLVLDFGGQYSQLIARRVREYGIYCEVHPYKLTAQEIKDKKPVGIILSGGPESVNNGGPKLDPAVFELGIPLLGICYGAQLMSLQLGGQVAKPCSGEFGKTKTNLETDCELFSDAKSQSITWMSHYDCISELPSGFEAIATTEKVKYAAMQDLNRKFFALQFHPEVEHTEDGKTILCNFMYKICGAKGNWSMETYADTAVAAVRAQVGDGKVLLALSGGVDSSVLAALLAKAVGEQLTCIFVDHGLMRKNEGDEVEAAFSDRGLNFIRVNAEERFLERLKGVTEPEQKRKAIGEEFIRVFEEEAKKIGKVDFLAQGTIYPDVIESGIGDAAVIKSHHNVGGLPDKVDFKELVEPLRMLFKDEVRRLGMALGLPDYLVWRQPFPGPGLGIRVIGEVTKEKLDILRDADLIYREEIANAGLDRAINQYFAVLTGMRSVGVMGDQRTYDYTLALRGVTTTDFMTADWARIPYDVLDKIVSRIVQEVSHINRIVYDITSKPPGTIEWE